MSQSSRPVAAAIDVDAFTRARTIELAELRAAVLSGRQNRCAHQNLNWHLRRRTLSYSSRRAPARIRSSLERELASNGARPPRSLGSRRLKKYRARARFLRSYRALRNGRPNRLMTHEWHAKRFHMTRIPTVDRIVPDFCNDRGIRSAFKAFSHSSIAHDSSYYDIIAVSSTNSDGVLNSLSQILASHDAARLATIPIIYGMRCARRLVLLDYASKRAIAPIDVLFRPNSGATRTCWIWVHPIASDVVLESIQASANSDMVSVELLRNELQTFRVFGPRAGFVIGSVIQRVDEFDHAWDMIRYARSPATSPACCVIAGEMLDPRRNFPPKRVENMAIAGRDNKTRQTLVNASYTVFSSSPNDSRIWDSSARSECGPVGSGEQNVDGHMRAQHVPFLIIQRPGGKRGLGAGWDVIVPKSWGRSFWRSLMYANGSRAIGLTELSHLTLETNEVLFPYDFPDSVCAVRAMREIEVAKLEKYNRKPKSKRVNYDLYKIESPYFSDLAALSQKQMQVGQMITGSATEPSDVEEKRRETTSVLRRKKRRIASVDNRNQEREISGRCAVEVVRGAQKIGKVMEAAVGQIGRKNEVSGSGLFVRVEVTLCGRGVVLEHALLCKASERDLKSIKEGMLRWEPQEKRGKRSPTDVESTAPGEGSLRECIGRVMRGGFSMARGGPKAIGFLSVTAVQQLLLDERCKVSKRRGERGGQYKDDEQGQEQVRVRLLVRNCESLQYRMGIASVL